MKKVIRMIIPVIVLLAALQLIPTAAQAADADWEQLIIDSFLPENTDLENSWEITDLIITGTPIHLDEYGLTIEQFREVFCDLRDSSQIPWYVLSGYSYSCDQETGLLRTYYPYILDPQDYNYTAYEQAVAEALEATVHEGMDQWQIALSVHDYLVTHCAYDESLVLHTGYDLLVNGSTVCDGYARAYMDLMNRVGIPCIVIGSEEMNHAWNLINIYGNWYHVDVTWDDPISDVYGQVYHSYFLLTDADISSEAGGHYGWETDITCTDTSYTDAFWKDINSAINYPSSEYSYYRYVDDVTWQNRTIWRTEATGEIVEIHTDDPKYYDLGSGNYYCYYHNSLTLWNGRLYANTMDCVYSMNPDGSDVRTEFVYDVAGNRKYIRGCFVEDGILQVCLSDHSYAHTPLELALDPNGYPAYHSHSYTQSPFEPTCTQSGYSSYLCDCGLSFVSDHTAPTGHTFGDLAVIQEPTVSTPGTGEYTCINCGLAQTEEIPTLISEFEDTESDYEYTSEPEEESPEIFRSILITIGVIFFVIIGIKERAKKK